MVRNILIMGSSGRDFHNFNVLFRNNAEFKVVAFTVAQSPLLANRIYPPSLAGRLYPEGIKIYPEDQLESLIEAEKVSDVYFAYSDVSHEYVMHRASIVQSKGASFHLLGPHSTMLRADKPIISIVGTRTGAGKSTISRKVADVLVKQGHRPVVVRHPMPYGELTIPIQRFENFEDLDKYRVTIEEREEYEGHINRGLVVYAGLDYKAILESAQREGDTLIWDGGNNDFSFYRPDLNIVVADPLRQGHESRYYPGETNVRMADIIVVNKVNIASPEDVEKVIQGCAKLNPKAKIVKMRSEAVLDRPEWVRGKKVLVVEDASSVTRGELAHGAGAMAAKAVDAVLVDPRSKAIGSLKSAYEKYPTIGSVLPALGYNEDQLRELEESINAVECDAVVLGTPADLTRLIKIGKPVARVKFEAFDVEKPSLEELMNPWLAEMAGIRQVSK